MFSGCISSGKTVCAFHNAHSRALAAGFGICHARVMDHAEAIAIPVNIAPRALVDRSMIKAVAATTTASRNPPFASIEAVSAAITETDILSRKRMRSGDISTLLMSRGPDTRLTKVMPAISRIAIHVDRSLGMK